MNGFPNTSRKICAWLQKIRNEGLEMNVCIVGAGAIGGWIGTRLANNGVAVSALARGKTLAALNTQGWRLRSADGELTAPVATASDNAQDIGIQDLIVVAVKAQSLPSVTDAIKTMIGPGTVVLPAMNGVPWWFCREQAGFAETLSSVDPTGQINAAIPYETVVGCVVHGARLTPEAGLVEHRAGNKLLIGEPGGGTSERASAICDMLTKAGFEAPLSSNIRYDTWYKLWGNLTMNPVSALTLATVDNILGDPLVRNFCSRAMLEAQEIGRRIGCTIDETPEARHQVTANLGGFKTSMLQDLEAGKQLELDAIVSAVRDIGQQLELDTPAIDSLLGLTRLMAQSRGLYPA
jgi:2-dehydropantoate 2-reductase